MKKILIIGLGSIGQRHLRNLNTIDKKFKFLAFRRKKIVPTLNLVLKNCIILKLSRPLKTL